MCFENLTIYLQKNSIFFGQVRIVSKTTPRDPQNIPKMEDLMGDLGDGCCVAAAIAFYQPENFPISGQIEKKRGGGGGGGRGGGGGGL